MTTSAWSAGRQHEGSSSYIAYSFRAQPYRRWRAETLYLHISSLKNLFSWIDAIGHPLRLSVFFFFFYKCLNSDEVIFVWGKMAHFKCFCSNYSFSFISCPENRQFWTYKVFPQQRQLCNSRDDREAICENLNQLYAKKVLFSKKDTTIPRHFYSIETNSNCPLL